jgi:hypothetical protein
MYLFLIRVLLKRMTSPSFWSIQLKHTEQLKTLVTFRESRNFKEKRLNQSWRRGKRAAILFTGFVRHVPRTHELSGVERGLRRTYLHSSKSRVDIVVVIVVLHGVDSTPRRAPHGLYSTVRPWSSYVGLGRAGQLCILPPLALAQHYHRQHHRRQRPPRPSDTVVQPNEAL